MLFAVYGVVILSCCVLCALLCDKLFCRPPPEETSKTYGSGGHFGGRGGHLGSAKKLIVHVRSEE